MSESSSVQKPVIDELELRGYSVFIVITANRNGISDIVGCDPYGKFCAFETKLTYNSLSTLQVNYINEIRARRGRAGCVKNIDELNVLLEEKLPLPQIAASITKINL